MKKLLLLTLLTMHLAHAAQPGGNKRKADNVAENSDDDSDRLAKRQKTAVDPKTIDIHAFMNPGQEDGLKKALDAGADVDFKHPGTYLFYAGSTALHQAALNGMRGHMQILLDHGASVDARLPDNWGFRSNWTPLHCAAWYGEQECIQMLLDQGASVDAKDNFDVTPLGLTPGASSFPKPNRGIIRLLVLNGADEKLVQVDEKFFEGGLANIQQAKEDRALLIKAHQTVLLPALVTALDHILLKDLIMIVASYDLPIFTLETPIPTMEPK